MLLLAGELIWQNIQNKSGYGRRSSCGRRPRAPRNGSGNGRLNDRRGNVVAGFSPRSLSQTVWLSESRTRAKEAAQKLKIAEDSPSPSGTRSASPIGRSLKRGQGEGLRICIDLTLSPAAPSIVGAPSPRGTLWERVISPEPVPISLPTHLPALARRTTSGVPR